MNFTSLKWYFGNNRSKNLRISQPQWYAPFFLTTNYDYAKDYADYGVYSINLKSESSLNILDFSNSSNTAKLGWPPILIKQIISGMSDLNSIAYELFQLAHGQINSLSYIANTPSWRMTAMKFKQKSKNILQIIPKTQSIWEQKTTMLLFCRCGKIFMMLDSMALFKLNLDIKFQHYLA